MSFKMGLKANNKVIAIYEKNGGGALPAEHENMRF